MKVYFTKPSGSFKRGDTGEVDADKFVPLNEAGIAVTATEWARIQAAETEGKNRIRAAIDRAKTLKLIEAKDETELNSCLARFDAGDSASTVVDLIEAKYKAPATPAADPLTTRATTSVDGRQSGAVVRAIEQSFPDTVISYLKASEPVTKTNKEQGGMVRMHRNREQDLAKAVDESRVRAGLMGRIVDMVKGGADFSLANIIKAADYVDPGSGNPLGTLNTDMLLAFNLGYLENQLAMLEDITTDISNQSVQFNQTALTRYIQVPGFQSKVQGTGWSTGTGGQTVDVNVKMDKYIGVPLSWGETLLGATTRNLPNEFKTPQLYGLGEAVIYYLIINAISGNSRIANDGTTTSTITFQGKGDGKTPGAPFSGIAGANLATFTAALPEKMDLSKFPGGDEGETDPLMRFAWVHTTVYSLLAGDTNLLLNQTIQALGNKINPNTFATGRINRLGNISLRKSQLMMDKLTLASSGSPAIQTVTVGDYSTATTLGIGGTRSALVFVSRMPLDYTKVMPDVPSTAAIEIATSPRLGIQFAVVKYLDHNQETANMRAALMFGSAIGDERQAFLINR